MVSPLVSLLSKDDAYRLDGTQMVGGIDPSPTGGYFAVLSDNKVAYTGKLESRESASGILAVLPEDIIWVVESNDNWPAFKNSLALLQTATTAGLLSGMLDGILVPSSHWRRHIFGKMAGDKDVQLFVENTVKYGKIKPWNVHIRDAVATAWAARDAARAQARLERSTKR